MKDYVRIKAEWLVDALTKQSLEKQIEVLDQDIRKTTFGGGGQGIPDGDVMGDIYGVGFGMPMPRPVNPFIRGGDSNRRRARFQAMGLANINNFMPQPPIALPAGGGLFPP